MTPTSTVDPAPATPSAMEEQRELVVLSRRTVAAGVVELEVAEPQGAPLPAWAPGAHIDLELPDDRVRQYSLCGVPGADTWRLAVLLEEHGREGSIYVHRHLLPGTQVLSRGPRNHFELLPSLTYIFIAGGIGITPIMPMIGAAEEQGAEWALLYGGRTRGSMAYVDELARYGNRVRILPADEYGLLDLEAVVGTAQEGTLVYACGPEPLLEALETVMSSWPDALHVERFAAREQEPAPVGAFEIELARTGGGPRVVLSHQSVLDVVADAGVDVVTSCEEGLCGTCQTSVLGGTVIHRDSVLSAGERAKGDTMMICVSRCEPGGRLVLDL